MQQFSNNAQTTLGANLSDSATAATVASATGFAALTAGQYELVTIDDGTNREIVKVTARSGTAWTIARAHEGTTARAWPSGTRVSARLTAGTLAGLTQTALTPDLAALDHGGNARGTYAVNLQSGRTDAANVASGDYAVAVGYDTRASGVLSFAMGRGSRATAAWATATGTASQALGDYAVAVGGGRAYANASMAFRGRARGANAIAIGGAVVVVPRTIQAFGFHAVPQDDWNDQAEFYSASAQSVFCTPPVDLGVPPNWAAATAYDHCDIVKATAGGTVQYRAFAYRDSNDLRLVATSESTEPSWPGSGGDVDIDPATGNGMWVGLDWADGYLTESVPVGLTFFPTELAFICHEHSTLTGTPNISIGTAATPGLLVDADDVTITGAHQIYRFTLANPTPAIPSGTAIKITVNTAASAGRCVGRFLLSGYFVENPTNAV